MRNKGLLTLIGAVVLTVGYSLYDFQSEKNKENQKAEQSRLLKLDKDQIKSFAISTLGGAEIKLERSTDGWQLKAPVSELADQKAAQDYVEAATLELSKETVKEGSAIDWKIYGLDTPKATLSFANNAGVEVKIDLANKKNFAGDSYLRQQGVDKVYTASSTWINRAEKRVFDFRDKRWAKAAAAYIDRLEIKKNGNSLTLENKDGKWFYSQKPSLKLDQVKTSELIYTLNSANAVEIVKDGKWSTTDIKSIGKLKNEVTLVADFKDPIKAHRVLILSTNEKKENFVQVTDPDQILKINQTDMDKFSKMSIDSLRDRHEAFDFDKSAVKKIHVTGGPVEVDFKLSNEDWILQNEDKSFEYQKDRARSILALVRNFEISDFEAVSVKESKSSQKVEFSDEQGKVVFQIEFFSSYKKKIDGLEKNFILAKSSSYEKYFGLDEGTFRGLGLENLVKKREDPKKVNSSSPKSKEVEQ